MAHFLFIILHVVALLFGAWGLVLTIPLHLIYSAIAGNKPTRNADHPTAATHVNCPDCREAVRRDARKCKHCGSALVPQ